jgi:hypothetical protein
MQQLEQESDAEPEQQSDAETRATKANRFDDAKTTPWRHQK